MNTNGLFVLAFFIVLVICAINRNKIIQVLKQMFNTDYSDDDEIIVDDNWDYFIELIKQDKFEFSLEESEISKGFTNSVFAFTIKEPINGIYYIIYHFNFDNRTAVFEWNIDNKWTNRCICSSFDKNKADYAYSLLRKYIIF